MSNTLDIYLSATNGTLEIGDTLFRQKLTLVQYRVEFDSAAEALAAGYIKVIFDGGFTSGNNLITASSDQTNVPITETGIVLLLDNAVCTLKTGINQVIDMSQDLKEITSYRLVSKSLTGFANLHMVFNFDEGEII